jgi:hypothetical protein
MLAAASGEYIRRGKPLETTKWTLDQVHSYMQWQLRSQATTPEPPGGHWVGGFAWRLPQCGERGAPAELPADVPLIVKEPTIPAPPVAEQAYKLLGPHSGSMYLHETSTGRQVTLVVGPPYQIYKNNDDFCMYDGINTKYIEEMFNAAYAHYHPQAPMQISSLGVSSGSALLPGMQQSGPAASGLTSPATGSFSKRLTTATTTATTTTTTKQQQ